MIHPDFLHHIPSILAIQSFIILILPKATARLLELGGNIGSQLLQGREMYLEEKVSAQDAIKQENFRELQRK